MDKISVCWLRESHLYVRKGVLFASFLFIVSFLLIDTVYIYIFKAFLDMRSGNQLSGGSGSTVNQHSKHAN